MIKNGEIAKGLDSIPDLKGAIRCQYKYKDKKDNLVQCKSSEWRNTGLCYKHYQQTKSDKTQHLYKEAISATSKHSFGDVYEKYLEDQDILDMRPELSLLRSLTREILLEIKKVKDEGEQDFNAFLNGKEFGQLLRVIKEARGLAGDINRIEKERDYVIDIKEAKQFVNNVMNVVIVHVQDPLVRKHILRDVQAVPFRNETDGKEKVELNA